jgi:peptide/nickel transport system substrate-binding protein
MEGCFTMLKRLVSSVALTGALLLSNGVAQAEDRVLTVAAPFELISVDPAKKGYIFSRMGVAETLVTVDGKARPIPLLATEWSQSADHLTWRFKIREGVVFHDGTPMTVDTVAAALNWALAKPGILGKAPVTAIAAEGDSVVFTLSEPFSLLPAALANYTTIILAPASYQDDGAVDTVIGTGPFQVTNVAPPQKMEAERNDAYWGEKAKIDKVAYLSVVRGETRALMAESGDSQLVFVLDPASMERLKRSDRMEVRAVPIPRTVTLKVNAGHPFLSDKRARQALSMAINRPGIATAILRDPDAAAGQLLPPTLGIWHQDALPALAYDPEGAKALLADLGWTPGEDGLLVRDGKPFKISLRTFADRPELPIFATAIQAQFREVGIDLAVNVGNSSEIPSGHQDGTLDLGLMARNFSLVPNPLGTLLQDFGPGGGDWGAMNWSNAAISEAMDRLATETGDVDPAKDRATITSILQDELPVIPVTWYQLTAAVNNGLKGVVLDPFELSYHLDDVEWVE